MANVNVVIIEGNLVQSAELRRWNDGTPYCRFTVANNETYKDQNGNYVNIPSYIDCQIKGNYGEAMSKYLLKGRRVTVTGRLKQNRWKDEQGANHSAVFIKVSEISLGPALQNTDNREFQRAQDAVQNAEAEAMAQSEGVDMFNADSMEEIPF